MVENKVKYSKLHKRFFVLMLASVFCHIAIANSSVDIGIIGDQTSSHNIDSSYKILLEGIITLSATPLDLVVHIGDLVESTKSIDEINRRFDSARKLLNILQMPWYLTAGDHDVNPPCFSPNSTDRSREQLYQNLYGQINPLVQE